METDVNKPAKDANPTGSSKRSIGVPILGWIGALSIFAALIYRIFWPWTGLLTDLIFAVAGVAALRAAKKIVDCKELSVRPTLRYVARSHPVAAAFFARGVGGAV